uniref:SRCR domain-containing protein n=1 Tax=Astyanax mexicanus TaxID=7994 RepID=A0A3B1KH11_ASTMX
CVCVVCVCVCGVCVCVCGVCVWCVCVLFRLVGRSHCSGRVEVLHGESWVTVCDADFNQQDAEVVCRELGCGSPVEVLGAAAFGRGEGQVWSEELQCRGNESQIHFCPKSSSLKHNCSHDNDVGLVCAGKNSVRLVGRSRCSGRVEVLHGESWVTVCDADFDQQGAEVVCRELGCGSPVEVLGAAAFGRGEGQVWSEELQCRGNESQIHFCPKSSSLKHNCSHDNDVGLVCSESVRLVDGGSRCAGRVEVLHGESWVTVCDADFDQQDAEVVCRELGCGSPVEVLGAAAFGRGEGQVWSEELQCRGNESQIHFCPKSSSLKHNCSHDNDVGLVLIFQISTSVPLSLCCADSVRLVDGGHRCAGRVEVFYNRTWRSVCGKNWDIRDAAVVCRELGCGEAVFKNVQFGPRSAWMDDVNCSGSESSVKHCRSAGWVEQICNRLAGVICSEFLSLYILRVRLVGRSRCSGRVEVLHGESWVTVCDADFNQQDAEVVCRELGCGSPVEVLGAADFGRGEGQVWPEEIQCRGYESHIYFCPTASSLKPNCSHDNDVGLVCAGRNYLFKQSYDVRLVDGGSRCAGRVEVFHKGQWGTVCDADFNQQDAEVVCRELGCMEALSIAHFGSGSGKIWMDDVNCTGSESTLKNCRSAGWGKHNCLHVKDAGIICSELILILCLYDNILPFLNVMLLSGSGWLMFSHLFWRVEVLHRGQWGTVCDADFNQQDADVVCRELGCGSPVEVLGAAAFGRGEGQVWSEELQ